MLIDIGESDIEDAENNFDVIWPWPRSLYGDITTYCKNAGAKVVVFDWLFQDRGGIGVADDEQFAEAMRAAGNAVFGLALTTNPLVDRAARGTVRRAARGLRDARRGASRSRCGSRRGTCAASCCSRAGKFELWYGGKKTADDVAKTVEAARVGAERARRAVRAAERQPRARGAARRADAAADRPARPQGELAQELTVASLIRERDGVPLAGSVPAARRARSAARDHRRGAGAARQRLSEPRARRHHAAARAARPARQRRVSVARARRVSRRRTRCGAEGRRPRRSFSATARSRSTPTARSRSGSTACACLPARLGVRGAALASVMIEEGTPAIGAVRRAQGQVRDRVGDGPGAARLARDAGLDAAPRRRDPGDRARQPVRTATFVHARATWLDGADQRSSSAWSISAADDRAVARRSGSRASR